MGILKPKYMSPSIQVGPKQVDLTKGCPISFTVDSDEPVTQIDLEFTDGAKTVPYAINNTTNQTVFPGYNKYYIIQDQVPYYTKSVGLYYYDSYYAYERIVNNMNHPLVQNFDTNVEEKFYLPGITFPNGLNSLELTEMFYIHHYCVEGWRDQIYTICGDRWPDLRAASYGDGDLLNDDFFPETIPVTIPFSDRADFLNYATGTKVPLSEFAKWSSSQYFDSNLEEDKDVITKNQRVVSFSKNSLVSPIKYDSNYSNMPYISFWSQNFYNSLDAIAKKHFGGYIPQGKSKSFFEKIFFKFEGKYFNENKEEKSVIIYFQLGANPTVRSGSFGSLDRIKLDYFLKEGTNTDSLQPKDYSKADYPVVEQDSLKKFLGYESKDDTPTLSLLQLNYQPIQNGRLAGVQIDDENIRGDMGDLWVNTQSILYNQDSILKNYINYTQKVDSTDIFLYNSFKITAEGQNSELYFKGAMNNVTIEQTSGKISGDSLESNLKQVSINAHYQALFIPSTADKIFEIPKFSNFIGLDNFGYNKIFNYEIPSSNFNDLKEGKIDWFIKLNDKDYAITQESFYNFKESNVTYQMLINGEEAKNEYNYQTLTFEIKSILNENVTLNSLQKIKYWNYKILNNENKNILFESENYYSNSPVFSLANLLSNIVYTVQINCFTNLDKQYSFTHSFVLNNYSLKYYNSPKTETYADSGVFLDWNNVISNTFSFQYNGEEEILTVDKFENNLVIKDGELSSFAFENLFLKEVGALRIITQPKSIEKTFLSFIIGNQLFDFQIQPKDSEGLTGQVIIKTKVDDENPIVFENITIPLVYDTAFYLDILATTEEQEENNIKVNIQISLISNILAIIPSVQNFEFKDLESKELDIKWVVASQQLKSFENLTNKNLYSVTLENSQLCYLTYATEENKENNLEVNVEKVYTPVKVSWDDLILNETKPIYCLNFKNDNNLLAAGENNVDHEIYYEIKVIRQLENENTFSTIWEGKNYPTSVIDYSLPNNRKANYWVHMISTENIRYEPILIENVYNYNHQWTLLVCDDVYEDGILNKNKVEVKEIYFFDKNIQSGSISNNTDISIVKNFTRYPKYQVSNSNYWSGSLTGLVGYIGKDLTTYHQTIEMIEKLANLTNDGKRKFLKDIEGNIWEIAVSAPIQIQNTDNLDIQLKTKTISWTQIGDAKDIMIYAQNPIGKEGMDYGYNYESISRTGKTQF